MPGWIVGFFLFIAGFITSLFIAKDALNFEVIKMVVAVLLFTLVIMIIAFFPLLKKWYLRFRNKNNGS